MKSEQKPTHTIPSGMGGSFNVSILKKEGNFATVEINHPQTDFHRVRRIVLQEDLRPIPQRYKDHLIEDHGNGNVEVVSPSDSRFIVGLDDSKHRAGGRISVPVTVQDAKNYIDLKTEGES